MSNLRFASPEHRDFFLDMMSKARRNDCYHRAFFYVMGIAPETRANIRQMFDFKQDCIEPDGMHGGWQTSGTVRVCRLAFNLWNGYTDPEHSKELALYDTGVSAEYGDQLITLSTCEYSRTNGRMVVVAKLLEE